MFFRQVSMTSVSSSEAVSCEAIALSRGHNLDFCLNNLTHSKQSNLFLTYFIYVFEKGCVFSNKLSKKLSKN